MKVKHIFCALLLCVSGMLMAQNLQENESALVYYMPFTWVNVDVEYQETTAKVGPFVQYAERYLGTKDVVKEDITTYEIGEIRISTRTTADSQRAYKVPLSGKGVKASFLTLDKKGILQAINLKEPLATPTKKTISHPEKAIEKATCMPLLEEQMMANSVAKMAEGAARQIYRIRETRLNILAGDVDHAPADGEAMRRVLKELDKQEQALTALFIGTKTCKTLHKAYLLNPAELQNGTLFRFSHYAGPVATDDLSGEPYILEIQKEEKQYTDEEMYVEQKKQQPTYIFYNLPGSATIRLLYNAEVLVERKLPIAQFGISVPLNMNSGLRDAQILFNTKTGAILSIQE